jgi:phage terminase small subunit
VALNDKQKRFALEYLKDLNATQAAIRAGYSKKTAYAQGQRLLKHVEVKEVAQHKGRAAFEKLDISVDRVLNEIARLAFLDPRKFYDEAGNLKAITELDDDTAAALAGMEVEEAYEHFGKGQAKPTGLLKKIKFADKSKNLEMLGRYHKLFTDKVEITNLDELATAISRARARAAK